MSKDTKASKRDRQEWISLLLRIIDLCKAIERKGDPFELDVKRSLELLRRYLPHWKLLDELLLDVEALNQLSSIVKLQGEWVKYRASSLYIDPLMIELKIRAASIERLVEIFINSWHPIVSIRQIFPSRLKKAIDYWNQLLPLKERFKKEEVNEVSPGSLSLSELIALKIMSKEEFAEKLQRLYAELESKADTHSIDYWEFITKESFEETVMRAYLISFLISGGYVKLKIDPIEERMTLIPRKIDEKSDKTITMPRSIAISLDYERWRNVLEVRKGVGRG
ncbi:MAG: hypothetical protein RMJ31_04515 [Nitrososphaerota archaeon]|nr:hypothetical protein [Nitrososphaerota archaeon]